MLAHVVQARLEDMGLAPCACTSVGRTSWSGLHSCLARIGPNWLNVVGKPNQLTALLMLTGERPDTAAGGPEGCGRVPATRGVSWRRTAGRPAVWRTGR